MRVGIGRHAPSVRRTLQRFQTLRADARLLAHFAQRGIEYRGVGHLDMASGLQPLSQLPVFEQQHLPPAPVHDESGGGDVPDEIPAVVQLAAVERTDEVRETFQPRPFVRIPLEISVQHTLYRPSVFHK